MDASLNDDEKRIYDVGLHSPSVFSSDPVETILAFKIANVLQYPGSRVLKALRGQSGLDPEMVRRVEEFVRDDPALDFIAAASQNILAFRRCSRNASKTRGNLSSAHPL